MRNILKPGIIWTAALYKFNKTIISLLVWQLKATHPKWGGKKCQFIFLWVVFLFWDKWSQSCLGWASVNCFATLSNPEGDCAKFRVRLVLYFASVVVQGGYLIVQSTGTSWLGRCSGMCWSWRKSVHQDSATHVWAQFLCKWMETEV